MERRFDTFIFDLDGTLLDTLPDLVSLTNRALREEGFPERTEQEVLSFVGGGVQVLMRRAVPEGTDPAKVEEAVDRWRVLYSECGIALTKPYEGVVEVLSALKERGKKLAVLSNKFDGGVQDLMPLFFPDTFDAAHGESADIPRKPDPTGLLFTMDEIGADPETTAYVGDSGSDMQTARNAGVFALGVSWGYRPEEELLEEGADAIVRDPSGILGFS